ncbi:hypothetical protein [Actibacterium sp. 188UL27-1]|uniref:hypothetical protein n=1 Tax=Actibacterium sp. 188UL27-1 TaxID=2786961 RepID=UPI00195BCFE2|nr:hypothetical protein [Actibacterium sp. 188UL27-1]MBM7068861.1 hypothetical protein [Actibacterium sp. 188UL27-1]
MMMDPHPRALSLGLLDHLPPWEAALIRHLRLWSDGPEGQQRVSMIYAHAFPRAIAQQEVAAFNALVLLVTGQAHRPLTRRQVGCCSIGADETVFAHLVRTASDGHLNEAVLIASLMVMPAWAEHAALLAAQVGCTTRDIANGRKTLSTHPASPVARLH